MAAPRSARDLTDHLSQPREGSALLVRVTLPPALDVLRRRNVADAALGVPAHVTLLYPFVAADQLTSDLRREVAGLVGRHDAFTYELSGPNAWPDTVYAAVEPNEPFLAIHRDLVAAFPEHPIYGGSIEELVPHVTVAEGPAGSDNATLRNPAWASLPVRRRATAVELVAPGADGRWATVWRLRLARGR